MALGSRPLGSLPLASNDVSGSPPPAAVKYNGLTIAIGNLSKLNVSGLTWGISGVSYEEDV